jgi:uncharacterized membrane protein YidH (DUF202 family)
MPTGLHADGWGGGHNVQSNGQTLSLASFNQTGNTIGQWKNKAKSDVGTHQSEMTLSDKIIVNEAQLILAEKRTSLATLRTGMAVFAIPLSVLGLLIATSRYYDVIHVLYLIVPLTVILAALIVLGFYLVGRALWQIRRYDRLILRLKQKHSRIAEFLD